jgi:sugar phosphate permease
VVAKSHKIKRIQIISVTLLVIAGLVNYLDRSTLSFANHSISEEMHLSATQMGLLLSAFSLSYAFAQLPVGVLLDRLGTRVVLGLGLLVWSGAQLAGGLVRTLQQFIIARVALGIGESPAFPAGAKVFSDWFAIRERGRPTGIYVASSTIAPAVAPPLLTWLLLQYGWRGMFITMGVLGILAGIAWIAFYRDRRAVALEPDEIDYLCDGDKKSAEERNVTAAEWFGVLGRRTSWGIFFGWVGVIYMVYFFLTWLPGYFEKERGVSLAHTGLISIIPYIAGTLGQLSSGFIADGLLARGLKPIASRKWPICTGLVFAALFAVPAAYTPSLVLAVLYISLAQYFVNLSSGAGWALVSVAAPRRLVATLGSFMNFGGYLGGAAAPLITGYVVDKTGHFVVAFLIAAAVSLGGALFYLFVVKDPIRDPL